LQRHYLQVDSWVCRAGVTQPPDDRISVKSVHWPRTEIEGAERDTFDRNAILPQVKLGGGNSLKEIESTQDERIGLARAWECCDKNKR
jgi:hypothetical protein